MGSSSNVSPMIVGGVEISMEYSTPPPITLSALVFLGATANDVSVDVAAHSMPHDTCT